MASRHWPQISDSGPAAPTAQGQRASRACSRGRRILLSGSRLDQMIDLRRPLAVMYKRLPWASLEAAVAPKQECWRAIHGQPSNFDFCC